MRLPPWTLGWLLLGTLPALAREAPHLDVNALPREGNAPRDFVPAGWKIEDTLQGDLNKDNSLDVVLQLVETGPEREDSGHARALLVLVESGGRLQRVGASDKVLYCTTCAGTLGATGPGQVKIDKGVLLVDQLSGSRESLHTLLRFRYEPKARRMRLIGEDVTKADRGTGESTSVSTNLLTGQRVTEQHRYDEATDKDLTVSTKKQKVPVSPRYLEETSLPEG